MHSCVNTMSLQRLVRSGHESVFIFMYRPSEDVNNDSYPYVKKPHYFEYFTSMWCAITATASPKRRPATMSLGQWMKTAIRERPPKSAPSRNHFPIRLSRKKIVTPSVAKNVACVEGKDASGFSPQTSGVRLSAANGRSRGRKNFIVSADNHAAIVGEKTSKNERTMP